jgi:hypothetical protein
LYDTVSSVPNTARGDTVRGHIKNSNWLFTFESVIAFLKNDEDVLSKMIFVVNTCLTLRHRDDTNSGAFISHSRALINNDYLASIMPEGANT